MLKNALIYGSTPQPSRTHALKPFRRAQSPSVSLFQIEIEIVEHLKDVLPLALETNLSSSFPSTP